MNKSSIVFGVGEYSGDSTQLLYLRARQYSSNMGRFLTKDPSRLEFNDYSYAKSNPLRFIDPTGLFSRDEIAKSLRYSSFDGVLAAAGIEEQWGLIAALLDALPGDTLSGGKLRIDAPFGLNRVVYTPAAKVGVDANGDITLNNIPIGSYRYAINSVHKWGLYEVTSSFGGVGVTHDWDIPWRYNGSRYYILNGLHGKREYVDGSDNSDYPDFIGMSGSVSFPGNFGGQDIYLLDRFGNSYLSFAVAYGKTLPIEFNYFEGYVGKFTDRSRRVSEAELTSVIYGPPTCLTASVALIGGIGGFGCLSSYAATMYSVGLQAGGSISYTFATFLLGSENYYSWDWAIQDRYNGTRRNDLLTMTERPYSGCNIQ